MELKSKFSYPSAIGYGVLIEPIGIEILNKSGNCYVSLLVLIEPIGIEIKVGKMENVLF